MLNTNEQLRNRAALIDDRLKRGFEIKLMRQLQPVYRKIARELERHYRILGAIPSVTAFERQIRERLLKHYKKVSGTFSRRIVKELGKPKNHKMILQSIKETAITKHNAQAEISAASIARTAHKDMQRELDKILKKAAQKDIVIDRKKIARQAKLALNRRSMTRLQTVAITETQNIAEHSKQNEIDWLHKHGAIIGGKNIGEMVKKKKWITILDTRTRHAHAMSDNQVVDFDKPYTVKGQLLMYPGDTSLGASLDNIINCRCSSVIIIRSYSAKNLDSYCERMVC